MTGHSIVNKNPQTQPRSLGYKIKLLAQINHRRLQSILLPYGLTPFHWLVLRCLWKDDGLPVSEITEQLQEAGGTMTGVLDRMEERGLIARVKDAADRRIWRIYLTKKGNELESELLPLVERGRKRLVKGINQKELAIFERVMDQLMDNCKTILGEND